MFLLLCNKKDSSTFDAQEIFNFNFAQYVRMIEAFNKSNAVCSNIFTEIYSESDINHYLLNVLLNFENFRTYDESLKTF